MPVEIPLDPARSYDLVSWSERLASLYFISVRNLLHNGRLLLRMAHAPDVVLLSRILLINWLLQGVDDVQEPSSNSHKALFVAVVAELRLVLLLPVRFPWSVGSSTESALFRSVPHCCLPHFLLCFHEMPDSINRVFQVGTLQAWQLNLPLVRWRPARVRQPIALIRTTKLLCSLCVLNSRHPHALVLDARFGDPKNLVACVCVGLGVELRAWREWPRELGRLPVIVSLQLLPDVLFFDETEVILAVEVRNILRGLSGRKA